MWVYRAQLQNGAAYGGSYALATKLMYVPAAFTVLAILGSLRIGWNARQNRSSNKWLVRITRLIVVTFHQLFFLSSINFYLMMLATDW